MNVDPEDEQELEHDPEHDQSQHDPFGPAHEPCHGVRAQRHRAYCRVAIHVGCPKRRPMPSIRRGMTAIVPGSVASLLKHGIRTITLKLRPPCCAGGSIIAVDW